MAWLSLQDVTKDILEGMKIPYVNDVSINHPIMGDFCFFPEQYLEAIMKNLEIPNITIYKREETSRHGMFLLSKDVPSLLNDSEKLKEIDIKKEELLVEFYSTTKSSDISHYLKSTLLDCVKKITPIIGKSIKIGIPHKNRKTIINDTGWFYIFIWSQLESNNQSFTKPTETAWGIHVDCLDQSYQPSGEGIPIITDEGYCIAELVKDVLYIHYDLCHHDTSDAVNIFEKIMLELIKVYLFSTEEKDSYLKDIAKKKEERNKINFISFSDNKIKNRIKILSSEVKSFSLKLEEYKREMINIINRIKENETILLSLDKSCKDLKEASENEYLNILKISKVAHVTCELDHVSIFTKDIYINLTNPTSKEIDIYHIGKFRINIYSDGRINFYNLTNLGKGPGFTLPTGFSGNENYNRHHPHIKSDGFACLGNLSAIIPTYISNNQLSVLSVLLIKFLETVYVEDTAGKGIFWWPKVKTEVKTD